MVMETRTFFQLFILSLLWVQSLVAQPAPPQLVVVSDLTWEVSAEQTTFGEYTLSASQIPAKGAPLKGGTRHAVTADLFPESRVIPGTMPIWASQKAKDSWESFQFRNTIDLGQFPVKSAVLTVNCDDASRVYINQKSVNPNPKSATLNDRNGGKTVFHDLTSCLYSEVLTYDVTNYFYTGVTNTVLVEMANQPYNHNHAYLSIKIVIEFEPLPEPVKQSAAATPKPKVQTQPKSKPPVQESAKPATSEKKTNPTTSSNPPAQSQVFDEKSTVSANNLRVGSILELGNVYFNPDQYVLDDHSFRTLDALVSFLEKNKNITIEVGGHTNLKADEGFAQRLSQNRAETVTGYLVSKGTEQRRITSKGYGKTNPKMTGTSENANRKNQRVEVKITGM